VTGGSPGANLRALALRAEVPYFFTPAPLRSGNAPHDQPHMRRGGVPRASSAGRLQISSRTFVAFLVRPSALV
jgi:hypothetical protein